MTECQFCHADAVIDVFGVPVCADCGAAMFRGMKEEPEENGEEREPVQ